MFKVLPSDSASHFLCESCRFSWMQLISFDLCSPNKLSGMKANVDESNPSIECCVNTSFLRAASCHWLFNSRFTPLGVASGWVMYHVICLLLDVATHCPCSIPFSFLLLGMAQPGFLSFQFPFLHTSSRPVSCAEGKRTRASTFKGR